MEDLDDLLDEAEKVCEVRKPKTNHPSEVNDHVSRLLEEFEDMDEDEEIKKRSKGGSASSWSLELTPPPTNMAVKPAVPKQCSSVQLGGANSAKGLSTLLSPRSCDALLCLSCNL